MIEACDALGSVGIALGANLDTEALVGALFHATLMSDGLRRLRTASWATDVADPMIPEAEPLFVTRGMTWHRAVLRIDRCLLHVVVGRGYVTVRIAHGAEVDAAPALAAARSAFPAREPAEDQTVPMWLWSSATDHGFQVRTRAVAAPRWAEIEDNYTQPARDALDRLMRGHPADAGRLIVWTGEPGTGKTTALRALAWEWRHRYALHCVVDPEALLGRPDYLLEVLSFADHAGSDGAEPRSARGLLLVLEDAGELLTGDAKERVGQGLSRLLNIADGLLGQGLDLLVLITTNEPVGRLHSALVRPGRCGCQLEFGRLSVEEASTWVRRRTPGAARPEKAATIADLFAAMRGESRRPSKGRLGFGGSD